MQEKEGRAGSLYVSPHLDDVALSCGGALHALARRAKGPLVATVFAAPLDLESTLPQAERFHRIMGIGRSSDPFLRHREDERAMEHLGASAVRLSFPDCIYRTDVAGQPVAVEDSDVFARPDDERALARKIAAELAELCSSRKLSGLVVPLALGGHRDHVLSRWAGEEASTLGGCALSFYEDVPYCLREEPLETTTALSPLLVPLEEDDLEARLDAIGAYESQKEVVWNEDVSLTEGIVAYTRRLGRGVGTGLAERQWGRLGH